MVLPTDKGRAIVILDADTSKWQRYLLPNRTSCSTKIRQTVCMTRKVSEKLLTFKRIGHISEAIYNQIRPWHKQPPRIYGLPKIHKAGTSLTPILSCANTFAYDLSDFLANIVFPLTSNSNFTVKRSAHFVFIIASVKIQDSARDHGVHRRRVAVYQTKSIFKKQLKTFLFKKAFNLLE